MKKNITKICLTLLIILASSCSTNRMIQYQTSSDSTSSVLVKPSTKLSNVIVTVDGNIVWDKAKTLKSLTIKNIPAGNHEIKVMNKSWIYKEELNHKSNVTLKGNGETKTELVSVPAYSTGYYVYTILVVGICLIIPFL